MDWSSPPMRWLLRARHAALECSISTCTTEMGRRNSRLRVRTFSKCPFMGTITGPTFLIATSRSYAISTARIIALSRCPPDAIARPCSRHWKTPLPCSADANIDLLLFQAGADPYFEDPYSPLKLDHDDLLCA